MKLALFSCFLLLWNLSMAHAEVTDQQISEGLQVMGHRNWIVVADMAYPEQSNPAIETLYVGGEQVELVKRVLALVDNAPHVRPVVMLDAELPAVPDKDAPRIDAYRTKLKKTLGDRPVEQLPHEEIIGRLDETAKLFNVLILKTDMTLPYTSVFLELQCGYWSEEAEQRMRAKLAGEVQEK